MISTFDLMLSACAAVAITPALRLSLSLKLSPLMRSSAWEYLSGWVMFRSATLGQFCVGGNMDGMCRKRQAVDMAHGNRRQAFRGHRPFDATTIRTRPASDDAVRHLFHNCVQA
jgi:hypothetical protein